MSIIKEFREFAMRGNVVDLAVGVIMIVAFAIFMAIKLINKLNRKKEEPAAATPAPTKEEVLLTEIRDLLKEQNNRS